MSNTLDSQATTDPRLRSAPNPAANVGNTIGVGSSVDGMVTGTASGMSTDKMESSAMRTSGGSDFGDLGSRDNIHDGHEGRNTSRDGWGGDITDATYKKGRPLSDIERRGLGNKSTSGMGTDAGMGTIDNHQGIGEGTHVHHHHDAGTSINTGKTRAITSSFAFGNSPTDSHHGTSATMGQYPPSGINDTPTHRGGDSNTNPEIKPWKGKSAAIHSNVDDASTSMEGINRREPASGRTRMIIRGAPVGFTPGGAPRTGAGMGPGQATGAGYVNATASGSGQNSGDIGEMEARQGAGTTGKLMSGGKPSMKDKIIGEVEKFTGKITADANMINRGEEKLAGKFDAAKN